MKYVVSGPSGGDGSQGDPWGVWDDIDYSVVMADDGQITGSGNFVDQLRIPSGVATSASNRLVFFTSAASTDVSLSASFPAAVTRRSCLILSDYVTIDGGAWINGDDGAGTGIGIEANDKLAPHIINTECAGNRSDGIFVKSCQDHVIQFNDVHDNGLATVSGKGITAVSADGLGGPSTSGGLVSYNQCYNNVRQGLQVGGSNQAEPSGENICEYNEVFDNGVGFRMEDARFQVVRYNNIYNNLNPDKASADAGNAFVLADTRDAKIYKNTIQDAVSGVEVFSFQEDGATFNTNNCEIYSNLITRSGNSGPLVAPRFASSEYSGLQIYSNNFISTASTSVDIGMNLRSEGSGPANNIYNNIFDGGYDGLLISGNNAKTLIRNNIFSSQANRHINESGTGNACTAANNDYYLNTDSDIATLNGSTFTTATITTLDANALQVNPEYIGANFEPSNSALIGAGVNVNSAALDFTQSRGYNNPPSIGSYGQRNIGTQNVKIQFNIRGTGASPSGWNTTAAVEGNPVELFAAGAVVDDSNTIVPDISFELTSTTGQDNATGIDSWPRIIVNEAGAEPPGLEADDSADWPADISEGVWFTNSSTDLILEARGLPIGDWDFKIYTGARDESAVRVSDYTVSGDASGIVTSDDKQQSPMFQATSSRVLEGTVTVTEGGTINFVIASPTLSTSSVAGIIIEQITDTGSPTLTAPYSIGTNNGPMFTITTSDTLATIEGAGFFNDRPGYASLLKTGDVVLIQASDGTKMYNVTVDKQPRIISLSSGLVIA